MFKSQRLHEAVLASASRNFPALGINNRQHIVVDGFKVTGGVGFREYADDGVIRNCDVSAGFIQDRYDLLVRGRVLSHEPIEEVALHLDGEHEA